MVTQGGREGLGSGDVKGGEFSLNEEDGGYKSGGLPS